MIRLVAYLGSNDSRRTLRRFYCCGLTSSPDFFNTLSQEQS
jgi:hypothetical protein